MTTIPGLDPPSALRQRLSIVATAVPTLLLSAKFAYVLVAPTAGGNLQWAVDAVTLLLLEFFLVHAGFMSIGVMAMEGRARILLAAGLGAFYLLFVALFAYLFESKAMFAMAAVLLTTRLGGAATRAKGEFGAHVAVSVAGVLFYLGAVIGTTIPEGFPAFGFTPDVLAAIRPAFGDSEGVWIDEPHRAVAGAALYFLLLGLFDLARLFRVRG